MGMKIRTSEDVRTSKKDEVWFYLLWFYFIYRPRSSKLDLPLRAHRLWGWLLKSSWWAHSHGRAQTFADWVWQSSYIGELWHCIGTWVGLGEFNFQTWFGSQGIDGGIRDRILNDHESSALKLAVTMGWMDSEAMCTQWCADCIVKKRDSSVYNLLCLYKRYILLKTWK